MYLSCFILVYFLHLGHGLPHVDDFKMSRYPSVVHKTVCFNEVGCFDTEAPYSYQPKRPLPVPEDPAILKPYVRYTSYEHFDTDQEFQETPLTGQLNINSTHLNLNANFTVFVIGCYDEDTNYRDISPLFSAVVKPRQALQQYKMKNNLFVFGTKKKSSSILQNLSNLRTLGVQLARFIKYLQTEHGIDTSEKVWLMGIGCGAHLAGYVGERVVVNRITGLDPAGYLFEGEDTAVRLDRTDALYVDIVHTDSRPSIKALHAYMQPLGDVDFYVNGGFHQPNCTYKANPNERNRCDHYKAVSLFANALRWPYCTVWGHNVSMENFIQSQSNDGRGGIRRDLVTLRETCDITKCVPMGYDSPKSNLRGIKVTTTEGDRCSVYDQTHLDVLRPELEQQFRYWLFKLIPLDKYKAYNFLPPLKNACYPRYYMGCFDMSPPYTVMRSRPISVPDSPRLQRIEAWFYTRKNINDMHKVSLHPRIPPDQSANPFNPDRMTFLLIHGFFNSGKQPWLHQMKNVLLNKTDCNVIICNWGGGSVTLDYLQAAGNLRMASREYSNLLQFMVDHYKLNVTRVHLIGHSLGSHIAGFIGKSIPGIFQITALDPAQPWFQAADESVRITKNDATFVMAVHSDAPPFIPDLGFGMAKEVGDVDFYINGGFKQPKCAQPNNVEPMMAANLTSIVDLMKPIGQILVGILLCPHQSAVEIFTESIESHSCIFWGQSVKMSNMIAASLRSADGRSTAIEYKAATDLKCGSDNCSPLGLDTYFWPARGTFVIITKEFPPYCIYEGHVTAMQESFAISYLKDEITDTDKHEGESDTSEIGNLLKLQYKARTWLAFLWQNPRAFIRMMWSILISRNVPKPFIRYARFVQFVQFMRLPLQILIYLTLFKPADKFYALAKALRKLWIHIFIKLQKLYLMNLEKTDDQ